MTIDDHEFLDAAAFERLGNGLDDLVEQVLFEVDRERESEEILFGTKGNVRQQDDAGAAFPGNGAGAIGDGFDLEIIRRVGQMQVMRLSSAEGQDGGLDVHRANVFERDFGESPGGWGRHFSFAFYFL